MKISIVGGGIAGCASAYYLSQAGHDVTLFERDSLASHASGFALGGLIPRVGGQPDDPYETLSRYSIMLHKELAEQLSGHSDVANGSDLDFMRKACLLLVRDSDEEESMRHVYSNCADDHAVDIRWLDYGELSHIDARISADVVGGLYVGEAYEVDPYKLSLGLWLAAEQQGARLINRDVTSISTNGNRVNGVATIDGVTEADSVVVAAGPWSNPVLESAGVSVPVSPLKGQIIRLDAPGPPLRASLWWDADYATTKSDGLVWAGTTEERVGFDASTTDVARDRIVSSAVEMLPYLEDAELVQQTACLRPMTPDRMPIVDAEPGPDGLVIVTGAGRQGIMLGPAMGIAAAALATGQLSPVDVGAFSLARFS